ncbi:ribonuclease HII [Hyperthermus butylicus]|uniref:ribonuclease HII n=1 Tax=Hyperthermus butylicus TaxID=54248 RepID=UPI00064EE19F|nr:ribonuclease HII [Hyperthermus butylicus]
MVQRRRCRYAIGIDEAGRGPVIGPMVVVGVAVCSNDIDKLVALGVRDSKQLTPVVRAKLYGEILRVALHSVIVKLPPALLDAVNLNQLEVETFEYIASRIAGVHDSPEAVYVDAVGSPEKLAARLSGRLGVRVIAEPGADKTYPIVSAASIVAKVVRDAEIRMLRRLYGVRGSGYPTDPETIAWLAEEYRRNPANPPWFVRRTWSTLKRIAPGWYVEKQATTQPPRGQRSLLDYLLGEKQS